MRRPNLLMIIAALGPAACLPPAEDAGEVDPTESSGADGGAPTTGSDDEPSGTDGVPSADAVFDWSLELEPDLYVLSMIRTPEGVLVALQTDLSMPDPVTEVREYSSSMELLWSQSFSGGLVLDLEAIGDGEFLATGLSEVSGSFLPTVWRVSCCTETTSQSYPALDEYFWIIGADLRDDGLVLAVHAPGSAFDLFGETSFLLVPLDLGPATDLGIQTSNTRQIARTPSSTVLVREDCGSGDCISELGVDGGFGSGGRLWLLGKGDELTLLRFGEDQVEIMPYTEPEGLIENEWVTVPTPGFAQYYDESYLLDRHTRSVLVHREDEPDFSSDLHLVEFDDDGTVVRSVSIPHLQHETIGSIAMAVGEDDAIYIAVDESELGGEQSHYLHRIAPL